MLDLKLITTGIEFESYCGDILRYNGFINVQVTQASNDFGVDVLAEKDEITYAIQCKYYSSSIGPDAVQEIVAGKQYYGRDIGVVMTNSTFTSGAIKLAQANCVKLWDKYKLITMIPISQLSPSTTSAQYTELSEKLITDALNAIWETRSASTSLLQRKLHIGYSLASRTLDALEDKGYVGPFEGSKPREIVKYAYDYEENKIQKTCSAVSGLEKFSIITMMDLTGFDYDDMSRYLAELCTRGYIIYDKADCSYQVKNRVTESNKNIDMSSPPSPTKKPWYKRLFE